MRNEWNSPDWQWEWMWESGLVGWYLRAELELRLWDTWMELQMAYQWVYLWLVAQWAVKKAADWAVSMVAKWEMQMAADWAACWAALKVALLVCPLVDWWVALMAVH